VTFPALAVVGTSEAVNIFSHAGRLLGIKVQEFTSRHLLDPHDQFDVVVDADARMDVLVSDPDPALQTFVIVVARSPHGQAATWPVSEAIFQGTALLQTVTPAPSIDDGQSINLQSRALDEALARDLVGVMSVHLQVKNQAITTTRICHGVSPDGYWTLEGARTSVAEQHLRAIFNLPLGSTNALFPHVVMRRVFAGDKPDMYYPYLHLFARDPELRIHQYGADSTPGAVVAHLSVGGSDVQDLLERAEHAALYFSGEIDE
jgi:5-(carboxyamino)imidazole ribonucleotide synthase